MKYIINCFNEVELDCFKKNLGKELPLKYNNIIVNSIIEDVNNNEVILNILDEAISNEIMTMLKNYKNLGR